MTWPSSIGSGACRNRPALDVLAFGKLPKFSPSNATMDGWAEETTLDVEYAHAIAPGAKILLVETPTAETEGVTGFPEMMNAEKYVIDRNLGDVISQSFGATENTFPGFGKGNGALQGLRYTFEDAASHGVSVLAASGDSGATNDEPDGASLYPYRAVSWPSSDPRVTSVGGTQLLLAQDGNKIQPDEVWNDTYGAGGGGVSSVFSRPAYQAGVATVTGGHRAPGHLDVRGGQRRLLGLRELRAQRGGRLGDPRRDERGDADVRRHRGPGRPAGGTPPRQHRPGALRSRGGKPEHRRSLPHRDRRRDRRQQHVRPGDRVHRHARLRPGQRVGNDRRRPFRPGAGPPLQLTPPATPVSS